MTKESGQKLAYLACFVVVSVAIAGYFTGLQSPMNPLGESDKKTAADASVAISAAQKDQGVVLSAAYSEMRQAERGRSSKEMLTSLKDLKTDIDVLAEVQITPQQKTFALAVRDQNRAFNGAPPTIPHAIDQMKSESCLACHGEGFKSESLRISKMSHQFLANCTQCHVENKATFASATKFRENSFIGLPAPEGGPRAFAGAPPQIPHSTWMRVDCMSCHGPTGMHGIRATHPWRQNCQQCHAPSSKLDQTLLPDRPKFLPGPKRLND